MCNLYSTHALLPNCHERIQLRLTFFQKNSKLDQHNHTEMICYSTHNAEILHYTLVIHFLKSTEIGQSKPFQATGNHLTDMIREHSWVHKRKTIPKE